MAPAPELDDAAGKEDRQPGSNEARIRRNVACVNCRNSKVRCRSSETAGQPCQRCAKLEIACVVDKSHRRITRRSKLEQLEQELKVIKQAVNTKPNGEATRPSRSPRLNLPVSPLHSGHPSAATSSQPAEDSSSRGEPLPTRADTRPSKGTPTKARTIGAKVVDGAAIDSYFDKYLQHFHPYVPVLRKKDPDECYDECPILFWIIIVTACRRYCQDQDLVSLLAETISRDIWSLLPGPVTNLESIHALLLLCAYPLPTIRLATDPSTTYASMALHLCMLVGLHTGKASHHEFFFLGPKQHISYSDEEASVTWLVACVLAERSAASMGHPSPSIQLNDGPARQALASPAWTDVLAMFDIQRFLNRMHLSMATHIASNGSVTESIVASWEDDFESVQALASAESEVSRFMLLCAKLEIQVFYFGYPPDRPGPHLVLNSCRTFGTAKSIVHAAVALGESPTRFLQHAPHWAFRSILDAASFIILSLHSHRPPVAMSSVSRHSESLLVEQAVAAMATCSTREGDLPSRAATYLETFWSARDLIPKTDGTVRAWPHRLGAGLMYWCTARFISGVKQAKEHTAGARETPQTTEVVGLGSAAVASSSMTEPPPLPAESFLDADLAAFLDDFGWDVDDQLFMGLP